MRLTWSVLVATLVSCAAAPSHPGERASLRRHAVDSGGHPMTVWEKSPANPRAAILLLHGRTWSSLPDFDLQVAGEDLSLMDGLVAEGFATYALDLRGYGGTPRDKTGWLTPGRSSADVAEVLAWLYERTGRTERPYLFGWSLGSMVAQLTVQQNPGLAAGVVLFGYPHDPARRMASSSAPGTPPRRPNTAAAAASDFVTPGTISDAAIKEYVRAALAADKIRVDWTGFDEFNALDPARVTVPTLLIQGERDPYAKSAAHAALFAKLGTRDRTWITLPNADHAALLETARPRFIRAIVDFIERPRY